MLDNSLTVVAHANNEYM